MGELTNLIEKADGMDIGEINAISQKAEKRILRKYTWKKITEQYKYLFS